NHGPIRWLMYISNARTYPISRKTEQKNPRDCLNKLSLTPIRDLVNTKKVTQYQMVGRVISARPQDRALRQSLRNLPRPTFEQAYRQTRNALKARPLDKFSKSSSKNGLIIAER